MTPLLTLLLCPMFATPSMNFAVSLRSCPFFFFANSWDSRSPPGGPPLDLKKFGSDLVLADPLRACGWTRVRRRGGDRGRRQLHGLTYALVLTVPALTGLAAAAALAVIGGSDRCAFFFCRDRSAGGNRRRGRDAMLAA